VPFLGQLWVFGHRPALTKFNATPSLAVAEGASKVAFPNCQVANYGLPLMVPAAFMDTTWAFQPDLLTAPVGEVTRQLAQVEGGVPHALNDLVFGVRQHFLSLGIETFSPAMNAQVQLYPWLESMAGSQARCRFDGKSQCTAVLFRPTSEVADDTCTSIELSSGLMTSLKVSDKVSSSCLWIDGRN